MKRFMTTSIALLALTLSGSALAQSSGDCDTDADCTGAYEVCVKVNVPSPTLPVDVPAPADDEPGIPSDGGAETPPDSSGAPMPPQEDPPVDTEIESYGYCQVDLSEIAIDDDCMAMCEAVADCAAAFDDPPPSTSTGSGSASSSSAGGEPAAPMPPSDGGGSDDDPGADDEGDGFAPPPEDRDVPMPEPIEVPTSVDDTIMCARLCSYSKAVDTGASQVATLETCVASANSCDAMQADCEDEAAAWIDEVDGAVDIGSSLGGGEGTVNTPGSASQDETANTDGGAFVSADGGCSAGGNGLPLSSALMALLAGMFLVLRRRSLVGTR